MSTLMVNTSADLHNVSTPQSTTYAHRQPVISVVLPVYNVEKYVGEALESILRQTFDDFEIIVINDASTDGTLQVVESYHDPRIRIVNNAVNLGLVKTLNKGMGLATGEFIARMDGDDVSHPQRFEKQIAFFKHHADVDVCGTWAYIFGENIADFLQPSLHHKEIKAQLLFLNRIIHPSLMFRRKGILKHNVHFDERFVKCEDYGLWVEQIDNLRFANLPQMLLSYRLHDDNYSIPKKINKHLIRDWNIANYETLLQRAGVVYSKEELQLHHSISFPDGINFSKQPLEVYVKWFQKIINANNKSAYFDHQCLANEMIERIILLNKIAKNSVSLPMLISRHILRIFSLKTFLLYLPFKMHKTQNHNKNLALTKRVGSKPLMIA